MYRPLYWLTNADRHDYERLFGIVHSDCYGLWGFERTGCVGCPFNRRALADLEVVSRFEPNMARAANKVFGDAYEYTRMYREYAMERESGGQLRLRF